MAGYYKTSFSALPPIECPCGTTKRAFTELADRDASVHYLKVSKDARVHYHRNFVEFYTVLEGEGYIEIDGEKVPVKPLDTVKICRGARHRAVGQLTILNVAVPTFDPEDEHFD
ncbi:MAG: cupin domain-containing protein [Oscillospiraceae bacterium]|nr:cupin domain-containing protein [Oscillospiraceae bacterium]